MTAPGPGPDEEVSGSPGRFGWLLLLLIVQYLVSAFVTGAWLNTVRVLLFAVIALLALRNWSVPRRIVSLVLAVTLASAAVVVGLLLATDVGSGVAYIWIGVALLFTVIVIVRRILSFNTVMLQSIYGAVSAYLILGLMFASFFSAINYLGGDHFFANGQPATTQNVQYFSFTTLTTLGYGDFTAAGNPGKAVAVLEALTGQIFLATLVARLVAGFQRPRERTRGSPPG